MNFFKVIMVLILRDVNESIKDRSYWWGIIFNTLILSGVIVAQIFNSKGEILQVFGPFFFIFIPSFGMMICGVDLFREKFVNDRILGRWEVILTTPISFSQYLMGKVGAVFLLNYPVAVLLTAIIFLTIIILEHSLVIPIFPSLIMALVISPMIVTAYIGFLGWFISRFPGWEKAMTTIATFGVMFYGFLIFGVFPKILPKEMNITWGIIIVNIMGLVCFIALIFFLVSRLDKEKSLYSKL